MKTGLKISDSGLADVVLSGEGLTVSFRVLFSLRARAHVGVTATVHLVSLDQDKSSVFKVKDVVVKAHTLHPRLETRPLLQNLRTARYSFRQARK